MNTSPAPPPLVDILNLHMKFGSNVVLRDISLTIPRGQTLAIIGETGCGKTVLLKSIIGLIKPSRGRILFDGHDLSRLNDRELIRQRIRFGFLFQSAALFDSMTVGQNVAFPLRQHTTYADSKVQEMVLTRLAEVGLPDSVITMKPAELSGGMRKRVGIARALVMDPELMVYDEPTTGLDPIVADVINELMIRSRQRSPVTSLVVTHDMRTARKVADRIVMLYPVSRLESEQQQVIYDGSPEQLDQVSDSRVSQFVRGEAGERLMEMRKSAGAE